MRKRIYFRILGSSFLIFGIAAGVFLVQSAVRFFSGASGTPANLVIDMSGDYGTSPDAWRNLAQGGESRGSMLTPVISQVRSLKPEYIRIDHVFDFYDQGQLDTIIREILSTGAKPFIAMSYMPPALSSTGNTTDSPRNWSDWEVLVQSLIQHVSGRNGLNISDVYYEVWNEPDLFGGFKTYGSKNYLDLYRHSAIGASRVSNTQPFKFGGPATTGYYSNWMNSLLSFASRNNLRLDFLSWHKYSKNMSDYLSDVANARGLLVNNNMAGREMIISEMGPNGDNDPVNDSNFGAIHELATSIILQNEVAKTFTFEIIDGIGTQKYWGRWGLYTNDKFGPPAAKPRAQAFSYLNNMIGGSKLNVFGQGSWVISMAKKISPRESRILIVNYDPRGIHNESVPIKLSNLPSNNFTLKRVDFLGSVTSQEVATELNEWNTSIYMKPNSAVIFEIIYK